MKVFEYSYDESWGAGQGIIIAESKKEAIVMLREDCNADENEKTSDLFPGLTFTEIDITKPQVIDHSWSM